MPSKILLFPISLVSKLRYDSALYLPYQGPNSRRKYGDKLNPRKMPQQFLGHTTTEEDWPRFSHAKGERYWSCLDWGLSGMD